MQHLFDMPIRQAREEFERQYFNALLDLHDNITVAARHAGMDRSGFHRRLKALGIPTLTKRREAAKKAEERARRDAGARHGQRGIA